MRLGELAGGLLFKLLFFLFSFILNDGVKKMNKRARTIRRNRRDITTNPYGQSVKIQSMWWGITATGRANWGTPCIALRWCGSAYVFFSSSLVMYAVTLPGTIDRAGAMPLGDLSINTHVHLALCCRFSLSFFFSFVFFNQFILLPVGGLDLFLSKKYTSFITWRAQVVDTLCNSEDLIFCLVLQKWRTCNALH